MEKQRITTPETLEKLPSLPQVLVALISAVSDSEVDYRELADLIRQDTATVARLLHVANASYFRRQKACESVEDALHILGMETVKTLVITTAIRQYFSHFDTRYETFMLAFWRRSLIAAQSARVLASLTRYRSPAEAYLCGLLIDVGQLYLLTEQPEAYTDILARCNKDDRQLLKLEQEILSSTHCETGAALLEQWQLDNLMSEALRYHHAPASSIRNGHHLVKIINLSSELSVEPQPSEKALASADELFGLNEALTTELRQRIGQEVDTLANRMEIPLGDEANGSVNGPARHMLGEALSQLTRLQTLQQQLPQAAINTATDRQAIDRVLYLGLGIERCVVFTHNSDTAVLNGFTAADTGAEPDFVIDDSLASSLVIQCFQQQRALSSKTRADGPLTIADKQLLRHCGQAHLLCLPFQFEQAKGVIVAGATPDVIREQEQAASFSRELISAVAPLLGCRQVAAETKENCSISDDRLRETLHEVSNPLNVINNYLELLRIRLEGDKDTQADIAVLCEEIDRAGSILMRLQKPDDQAGAEAVDINGSIQQLASIFDKSMCLTRGIDLHLSTDPAIPPLTIDRIALKQILTNLLKNAIEAMPEGGSLKIVSQSETNRNASPRCVITVEDNGPGIPESVKSGLFRNTTSTKGPEHKGLGLKIVKQLMDSMKADIHCDSDASGTRFILSFPINNMKQDIS